MTKIPTEASRALHVTTPHGLPSVRDSWGRELQGFELNASIIRDAWLGGEEYRAGAVTLLDTITPAHRRLAVAVLVSELLAREDDGGAALIEWTDTVVVGSVALLHPLKPHSTPREAR